MKKCNKTISVSTFIFLIASFLFAPVNIVMADDGASGKATSQSDGKKDGKGAEEEPDCE